MAKPIRVELTSTGAKVSLKALYWYSDPDHGNLTFQDGTNWPFADEFEAIEIIAGQLLRPMQKAARAHRRGPTPLNRQLEDVNREIEEREKDLARKRQLAVMLTAVKDKRGPKVEG